MPRRKSVPSYTLHRPSGQARVRIDGRDHYLGPFGSEESRIRYGELIAAHVSGVRVDPLQKSAEPDDPGPSMAELLLSFLEYAETYYAKDGKPSAEYKCFLSALRPVRELYALLPVAEFGPTHLKVVRQRYVDAGWCRKFVNKSVGRLREVFRWGIESGICAPETLARLKAVKALRRGKTTAPDLPPRMAVSPEHIQAARMRLRQQNRDLVDLMLLVACRPGELIGLRTEQINQSGDVWRADLQEHKNASRDKPRTLFFGPRAQLILRRYLNQKRPGDQLFHTSVDSFSKAIKSACERAKVPTFTAHSLRHTSITAIRDEFGIEHAQHAAGHANPEMTAVYSRRGDALASEVARRVG